MIKSITMYELLGLIKNKKQPNSILFKNEIWFWGYDTYTTFECLNKSPDHQLSLFNKYRVEYCLNDKLEIIDDYKVDFKIKKITSGEICPTSFTKEQLRADIDTVIEKVNEIIVYLKGDNNE